MATHSSSELQWFAPWNSSRCPSAESKFPKAEDISYCHTPWSCISDHVWQCNRDKQPMHTSILTGQRWLEELLNGHSTRFYNQLGMKKHVFCRLLSELQVGSGLHDTRNMKAEEQLAVFLYLCQTGSSLRLLMERFQHSPDTISRQD